MTAGTLTATDATTTTTTPDIRAARGRFARGNPGGPGRPPRRIAHIERELLAAMATVLTPEVMMRVTQAMLFQALEGNVAAANWVTKTFMQGGLSQAAAAHAVGISAEAEMLVLGKSQHPEWARLLEERLEQERLAEERDRQAALASPAIATQPAPAPSPEVASTAQVCALETVETVETAETVETVETDNTVKTVEAVESAKAVEHAPGPAAGAAAGTAPPASPPEPRSPLTVPPSERVRGFRVTKGPRPPENGHKRSKPLVSPPPCVGH